MAVVTTSRTKSIPIAKRHLRNLESEFQMVSMFFREPLEIYVPHLDETMRFGFGLGGYSWSLFVRGEGCTACGRCCSGIPTFVWLWAPTAPQPTGLPSLDLVVNGEPIRFSYHIEDPGPYAKTNCSYLQPYLIDGKQAVEVNGIPMSICVLHGNEDPIEQAKNEDRDRIFDEDLKPTHCQAEPQTRAVRRRYGSDRHEKIVWERTLPSRNWAWPKCPIDLLHTPATDHVFKGQRRILKALQRDYGHLPGSAFDGAVQLWDELVDQTKQGSPPISTTFLSEHM